MTEEWHEKTLGQSVLEVSAFICPPFFKLYLHLLVSENGDKGVVNAKENGCLAAEFFFKAECNIPNGAPFTWFFVRPPWAPSGVCCKSCVFSSMVELSSNSSVSLVYIKH